MKFSQYISLKEADMTQDVETIFNQTTADIDKLFQQLYRGTAAMVQSAEKAKLPEELQRSIIDDLKRIAAKIKGNHGQHPTADTVPAANSMTDPRAAATENVMVNTYINSILDEVSAAAGLGRTGTSDAGKPIYDFKSTLTNARNLIMQRMAQLKDTVLKSLGTVSDIHSKIGTAAKQIGDIHGHTVTALSPAERESAEDALVTIGQMARGGHVQLFGDPQGTQPIQFKPNDRQGIRTVLSQVNPKQVYAKVNGQIAPIDLTNRQSWSDLQSDIQGSMPKFTAAPVSGNRLRSRKIKDAPEGGINTNQAPRLGG